MNGMESWIWWLVGAVLVVGVLAYLLQEYIAWLERSQIVTVPGGLRFVARGLQVEMQRNKARLLIHTDRGHYSQQLPNAPAPMEKTGPLNASFEAYGLRLSVSREMLPPSKSGEQRPSGHYSLAFDSKADNAQLRISKVPHAVATQYAHFAGQVELWIEKVEARRDQAAQAAAAAEAEAAERASASTQNPAAGPTLTTDAQVAQWRKNAGFSGSSSEIGLDDNGRIVWFVDLDPKGRITLHSDKRTVHTTLEGAELTSLGGELEIGVRDEFWSLDDPKLMRFRILKGRSPDERRAWRERLEILRNQLSANTAAKS